MKYFILFSILLSSLWARECYNNKQFGETICFYSYYDRDNIYNPKSDEKYYQTKNGRIYAISDEIEVKLNAAGAILTILDDYEIDFDFSEPRDMGDFRIGFNQYDLEFLDKKKGDRYIFRVKKPDAIFIILRKLNALTSVQSAKPVLKRKFTNTEIQRRRAAAKERRDKATKRVESTQKKSTSQGFQGGNFLKGGVQK